jgi:hypothetical protein
MFDLTGSSRDAHLTANAVLTAADFDAVAAKLGVQIRRARKIGYVAARQATSAQVVETRWNGKETTNRAEPGDMIVTNLSAQGEALRDRDGHVNNYVVTAERFPQLYEEAGGSGAHGRVYRAKGAVLAIPLPGGFDILAPWGERQTAPAGCLLFNGKEVYGCNGETFAATYEIVPD